MTATAKARVGEITAALQRDKGGRPSQTRSDREQVTKSRALASDGITRKEASEAEALVDDDAGPRLAKRWRSAGQAALARILQNLRAYDVALSVGSARSTIQALADGTLAQPNLKLALALAKAHHVPAESWFEERGFVDRPVEKRTRTLTGRRPTPRARRS